MPSASQETLDEYRRLFGDDATDIEAIEYIDSLGFLKKNGLIDYDKLTDDMWLADKKLRLAVSYLQDEWDY